MKTISVTGIDLALDELPFFEATELSLEWHAFFCVWFAGTVAPAARC